MRILVVKRHYGEQILDGTKPLEIRSRNTNIRERIGIAFSETGKVFGTVELTDSTLLSDFDFETRYNEHKVPLDEPLLSNYTQKWGWSMKNPKKFKEPIPYKHKQGCVTWVNYDLEGDLT